MDENLLEAYRKEDHALRLKYSKIGCIISLFFVTSISVLDYFAYPQHFWNFLKIRFVVNIMIAAILAIHYTSIGIKYVKILNLTYILAIAGGICCMIYLSQGFQSTYYGGLNLVLLCAAVLFPWTYKEMLVVSMLSLGMYVFVGIMCSNTFVSFSPKNIINEGSVFVFFTGVICIISTYYSSNSRFQDFCLRYQLDEKNKELDTKNKELEELDKLKSQFFANVSHELRTPLTLIISPIQDLLKKTKQLPEVAQDALLVAVRNAMRLLKLINELLETLKLDEGRLVLNKVQFEFSSYLKGLVESIEHLARAKKLTLTLEGAEEVISMYGDKDRLEKVFLNLLMNAIKYTPRGGRVIVRWYVGERVRGEGSAFAGATVGQGRGEKNEGQEEVKDTEDFGLGTLDLVVVEIEDTGVGIPAEQLPHIFDRFYQVDGGATRKAQGVGIGLSLVKGLVEKHGGKIEVESEEGKGSVFRVELPIYQKLEVRSEELEEEGLEIRDQGFVSAEGEGEELEAGDLGLWGDEKEKELRPIYQAADRFMVASGEGMVEEWGEGKYTILIVDDEPDMNRYLMWTLGEEYRVIQAKDGKQALALVEEKKPDLVLLDWMMPGMSGVSVCKQLRAGKETSEVRIIMLTARMDEESKVEALENGAHDFLTKPFSTVEVKARIAAQLRERELYEKIVRLEDKLEKTQK